MTYPTVRRIAGRHLELIILVAHGLSDREIGERLHLSRHTVHHWIERLRDELNLKNRVELAAWAGKHGLYPRSGGDNHGSSTAAAVNGSAAGQLVSARK